MRLKHFAVILLTFTAAAADDRKQAYVDAVTRGEGLLPGQASGGSPEEFAFRERIERRKDQLLAGRGPVQHPVLIGEAELARARRNADTADWARHRLANDKAAADFIVAQPADYVEAMMPALTPTNPYGSTCPNCVGKRSQEAVGSSLLYWTPRRPDVLQCRACKHEYPSEQYPESAKLICPRTDQTFTYYRNDAERAHPDDRTGRYAWHWVGYPIHVSFTGIIRERKISYMLGSVKSLAVAYHVHGDPRYAERGIAILMRAAFGYRQWLYHDYWDTIADCDPLYAAWHDKQLPLSFKRHACADAFKRDTIERARMLQSYWGAGRIHPSTDGISRLGDLAVAYDLLHDAKSADGEPLWTDAERAKVERDLFLEYIFTAEPYVGGAGRADNVTNKAPRVYEAMAAVGKCLGLPQFVDTALRGYEAVRDQSFGYDGFSFQSPAYTNMFLSAMVHIPETLHRFHWPDGFAGRSGEVDLYATDPKLRLMFRAVVDQLRPDGTYLPLSDTRVGTPVNQQIAEIGQKRYPEYYRAAMPTVFRERKPSEYSLFHLDADEPATDEPAVLPEICFPAWKTAILRHGTGAEASVLALAFNGPGGHRQRDVLSLYYADRGRTVLGDHGYVGDMPINTWIRSSLSHNLVVVDDGEQRPAGHDRRRTRFRSMFTSPRVSWAEASAEVYDACREYRRSVALIKGQDAQTIAVDIFRVTGGKKHAFRVFSDLAASDADDGTLAFDGLSMPPESPLPTFGASLAREHIFGLRDPRTVSDPPAAWRATWKQKDRRYRMWMASPASDITASNGPGQQTRTDAGRRVRYVDVIRKGENDLTSTFVAVHEPSGVDGTPPVQRVRRLDLPATAGDDAVAIEIASRWGTYLLLSEFTEETEVAGVRFAGTFGLLCRTTGDRRWLATSGARTLRDGDFGFANATASWSGGITEHTSAELVTDTPRPDDWPSPVERVTAYVRVESDQDATGFAVRSTATHRIAVERFPLPAVTRFHLPRVRVLAE